MGPRDGMERSDLAWLASGILLVVFVALDPLLTYPVFGSDTGEYYNLTSALLHFGHLPQGSAYAGWGFAYSEFPGLFEVSAATAGGTGMPVLSALQLVGPVLAALAIVPLFLLFRRLVPNDTVAILGAILGSLLIPRIYSVAHPAPLALGEALVLVTLWMLVESRRDVRWYVPLTITCAALVMTHHLSSYFFVVCALGLIVVTELVWPRRWSVRFPTRELVFLAAFLGGTLVYWFDYSRSFTAIVGTYHGLAITLPLAEAAMLIGFVLIGALLLGRRRATGPRARRLKFPSDRSVLRDAAILSVGIYGGVALLLVFPLPGSMQTTTVAAVVFFTPILLLVVLTSGSRRLLAFARDGPLALTWIGAVGLSALLAILLSSTTPGVSQAISPARHAEYLVLPLGLIAAICLGRLVGLAQDRSGRPAATAVAVGVVVLVGLNAAIAYPPPSVFGGFQEGLTNGDAAAWMWMGIAVPPAYAVASDHRLSSMVFGFDGNPATWDSTPALFTGSHLRLAVSELLGSDAPHTSHHVAISVVAVDGTMRTTGVALDPSQLAAPMSANATAWFDGPPFVAIYENGGTSVYWVDLAAAPG